MSANNKTELVFNATDESRRKAHISGPDHYRLLYKKSIDEPEEFWTQIAKQFYWKYWPNDGILSYNFDLTKGPIRVKWMERAVTNMCYNVLDRVCNNGFGDRIAYYWSVLEMFLIEINYKNVLNSSSNSGDCSLSITYAQLLRKVCKFSNVLKSLGIRVGDRIAVYMCCEHRVGDRYVVLCSCRCYSFSYCKSFTQYMYFALN